MPSINPEDVEAFVRWLTEHCYGRAQAKTAKALQAMGCRSSLRDLRILSNASVHAGHLVCADNAGYFVPASRDEVNETIGRLRSEAHELLRKAARLEQSADRRFLVDGTARLWPESVWPSAGV